MLLFDGRARFSPEVSTSIQEMWVSYGGKLTQSVRDGDTKYIFCGRTVDSWVASLTRKAIPVFHADWIVDAVAARFCIPIAPYLLNGSHAPSDELPTLTLKTPARQIRGTPKEPPTILPMKRPYEPQETPESPEQPRKKARIMDAEISTKKKQLSSVSPVGLVCQEAMVVAPSSVKKTRKKPRIPHIDLVQMQHLQRTSSLKIKVVRKVKSASDSPRLDSLGFQLDGSQVPRISLSVVQSALQDIPTDNCALFVPGAPHGGKTFGCDLPSSS